MNIGDKVWHNGDEVTITTNAYELLGSMWHDAITDSGKVVSMLTKEAKQAQVAAVVSDWKDQQAQFAKLHGAAAS